MEPQELPDLVVKGIKELSFSIDELNLKNETQLLKIDIAQHLSFSIEQDLVNLIIRIFYHYSQENGPTLAQITVQNLFEVAKLDRYQLGPAEIKLPESTISDIVGLSISHARALLAVHLQGTLLHDFLPAVIDSRSVAIHFFPFMFENTDHPQGHSKAINVKRV